MMFFANLVNDANKSYVAFLFLCDSHIKPTAVGTKSQIQDEHARRCTPPAKKVFVMLWAFIVASSEGRGDGPYASAAATRAARGCVVRVLPHNRFKRRLRSDKGVDSSASAHLLRR